jgi:peptide/nickel transport system substrate-binding protein
VTAAAALVAVTTVASGTALAAMSGGTASKRGGTITVLSAGDVDHIDPGAAYYSFTYEITYATQRPLLAYKPSSVKAVPDLAAAMPKVSDGGRTVTVRIRDGVRFSPPVNREVTSKDVKYAIERGFARSVANGYAGAYFGDIVGAPQAGTKTVPNIRGIQTPNRFTLVFHLKHPSGVFVAALGQPLTAPVPYDYARKFDSQTVSTYGMHQVATGPYMIESNASGSISGVGYKPDQLIELVRNPNWNPKTSWRPAYADRVLFKEGFQDPTVQVLDDPLGRRGRERRLTASARGAEGDPRQPLAARAAPLHADRGQSLRRSQHEQAALRQRARPQGRRVRARSQRDAADPRRRDRRSSG